jgi:hydrogenase expression/formation protein HypD
MNLSNFRDPQAARAVAEAIATCSTRPVRLMEFCGGHTHAILRFGIPDLLPPTVELLSGPGCPVCVTSADDLSRAIALAGIPGVILTTFGDMMRVPADRGRSLARARAEGADVRIVYSPLDALEVARQNPTRTVVFLGVGFETTAPMVASAVLSAEAEGIRNFAVFSTHKLTPPAMRAILDAGEVRLSGIIGPGHVTTIIGPEAWQFLPQEYGVPCAVAGFEPLDILRAILALVEMLETGQPGVANAYSRSVRAGGIRLHWKRWSGSLRLPKRIGGGWGCCPPAACAFGRSTPATMPRGVSRWRSSQPASPRAVAAATSCGGSCDRWNAPSSRGSVPPRTLSAPAWSAPRGPARPTTSTDDLTLPPSGFAARRRRGWGEEA